MDSNSSDNGNPCSPLFRPRVIINDGGSLSSPQYPFNYAHNSDCQWLIASPSSEAVGKCEELNDWDLGFQVNVCKIGFTNIT